MENLRINEAVELARFRAAENGDSFVLTFTSLARNLWPDNSTPVACVKMDALKGGKRSTVALTSIPVICDVCGVDANFLFDQPSQFDDEYQKMTLNIK